MGYSTNFTLDVYEDEYDELFEDSKIRKTLEKVSGYHWNGYSLHGAKWYNWEKHLAEVSENFPDAVLVLHGEGEDANDIWTAYARNGEVEVFKAEIIIGRPDWFNI